METGAYQKVTKSYCQLTFIKWVPGIVKYYLKKISTCYQRVTKHSQSNSITVYRMVFARKNQAEHAWVVKGSLSVSTNGGTPRSLISRELFIINQLVCGTGTHPHCAMGVKLMHFLRNYFEFKYEPKKYHKPTAGHKPAWWVQQVLDQCHGRLATVPSILVGAWGDCQSPGDVWALHHCDSIIALCDKLVNQFDRDLNPPSFFLHVPPNSVLELEVEEQLRAPEFHPQHDSLRTKPP